MTIKIKEIQSKSVLSSSKIFDYVINPYVGCQHACSYCYARFMKRFTGHKEPWGDFVDIKINAPDVLNKEIKRKERGTVWMSGVCDPYQPLEAEYKLTRRCLEILAMNNLPVVIQTRSPLVLRDMDLLKRLDDLEVGLSITTADDEVRKIFEPKAPSIMERINTIESLHKNGIRTFVMIAPILPEVENLIKMLKGKVDYIIFDRMNYNHADRIYQKHGWKDKNTDEYFQAIRKKIVNECKELGVECRPVY
jgi:DNA repair photolyase